MIIPFVARRWLERPSVCERGREPCLPPLVRWFICRLLFNGVFIGKKRRKPISTSACPLRRKDSMALNSTPTPRNKREKQDPRAENKMGKERARA